MDCGHGCSVSCPDGGGCVYNHSTGSCCTFCNGDDDINCSDGKNTLQDVADSLKEGGKIDIKLNGVTFSDLSRLMESLGIN